MYSQTLQGYVCDWNVAERVYEPVPLLGYDEAVHRQRRIGLRASLDT